ncbi:MAG: SAM-dependent methyltransferase [Tannerellaceae bacterium]|jgi:hypothetical protein|nr:SAM-dependent methyltransferase [Tannerellaceae bacterium]
MKKMWLIPPKHTLQKSVLLYRRLLRHKGHGVHSPFVYNLITKVIDERCPYYRFSDIEALRQRLLTNSETLAWTHRGGSGSCSVAELAARNAIGAKQGALLFRLTHYFQARHILQIGASAGLSTLYLTSWARGVNCIALEQLPACAAIARRVYETSGCTTVDLRQGDYLQILPPVLEEMGRVDFVFFNTRCEPAAATLFKACAACADDPAVFVFEGIKANSPMRQLWREVRAHPKVSVTLDLYCMGVAVFHKKLHKRDYTVYF